MKITPPLLVLALLCGCSWSGASRRAPDGATLRAWNLRFAWQTVGFEFIYATNYTTIRLQQSTPDAITAGAIAEGVARGLKPTP